jgi:P pilus assembly chaperone PapD
MHILTIRTIKLRWLLAIALLVGTSARADLMLYPNRIVFEGTQRTAQLELINRGTTSSVYRLKLVRRRMSDSGDFMAVDSPLPGELFADDLVRYSPRQITLAPGASQTIRLMVRKPADLQAGEYRSHLLFERVPDTKQSSARPGKDAPQLDIKLTALVSVTIPVIVRHGPIDATVALRDLKLEPSPAGQQVLSLALWREGASSVYGDLMAEFTPNNGAPQVVASVKGLAVYAPNALRRGQLTLRPGMPLAAGTLHVVFRERADEGGKLLAEAALRLP